jgi:hypothetical protein
MKSSRINLTVLYLFVLGILTSCSNYHVLTINSNDTQRNNFDELVNVEYNYEIAHSFKGEDLPIHLRVYNDDNRSYLNVDWSSSFIVVSKDTVKLRLSNNQQNKVAIKPGEFVDFRVQTITSNRIILSYNNAPITNSVLTINGERISSKSSKFLMNTTPLSFSTHIKLSFFDDFADSFYAVSSFWLDEVQRVNVSQERLDRLPGNMSYVLDEAEADLGAFVFAAVIATLPAIMTIGFAAP